jgi:hypothetical protein
MIRRLAFCLAVCSTSAHAQAQLHVLAGANFAELRGLGDVDLKRRTGAMGGLRLVIPLSSGTLALQPELLVTSKGASAANAADGSFRLTYAEVPLLLRVNLTRSSTLQPHVYAGPYAGYRINCEIEGVDTSCDRTPGVSTNTVDVGGILGGGVTFGLAGLRATVGARYGFGVSTLADFEFDNVRESAKNGAYAVYVGIGFGGR